MNATRPYNVIGTRPIRPDGVDKVTGRALYGADIQQPGLIYGKILRSPHAHARIRAIDTRAAAQVPGVRAIVTAADMPALADEVTSLGEGGVNKRHASANILARDKALYFGHAVAAVAADNLHIAEEALKRIVVDYEVLEPVLDGRKAMGGDAPILLADLRTNELGKQLEGPTNVAEHIQMVRGDPAIGFAAATVSVERTFHTATVHQGYIEPHSATALWNQDGQIHIWCSTQGAFMVQEQVAGLLDLPVSQVVVTPTEIGGGFGGKNPVYLEPVAALLSRKSGHRPVKMTMTRAECFTATGPTSGSHIRVKMAATTDGKITAAQAEVVFEAGAFPGSFVWGGCGTIFAPYQIEHVQIDGYDVVVNRPKAAAYRAPGGTNAVFASETVVDELAEQLGLDPLEFRLRNSVQEGDSSVFGQVYARIGCSETLEAARAHPHYHAPLGGPRRGRGVAVGLWSNWGGRSSAAGAVNTDGTVTLIEGSTDIGGSRASLAMQFAETLDIPYTDVRPHVVGTASVGFTEGTYGSRTTFATGWAVYELGRKIIAEMKVRAGDQWGAPAEEVTYQGGLFAHDGHALTFKQLAACMGQPVSAAVSVFPGNYGPGFAVHIVDVEVDEETGKVDILRYTAFQDVGTAIHPSYVEGQLQGGAVQGIGWALNEEYIYDAQGRLTNATLLDYRMPTALDLPMIDTVLIEVPSPSHPYGVRGVGETPIIPPAAAIANAIYRAIGVRMTELPMSPPRIVHALNAQG